jgi:hypothetical protein
LLGLVFKKGFAGLTLACALAVAPAAAQEQAAGPPENAGGPDGSPPAQAEGMAPDDAQPPPAEGETPPDPEPKSNQPESAPSPETDAPPADTDAPPPAATEPEDDASAERQRVGIRSIPGPAVIPPDESAPREPASRERSAPRKRPQPRARAERPAPAAVQFREAITTLRSDTAPVAAAASSSAAKRTQRAGETRSEPVSPGQPLPARVVPREVREIVEVVPGQIWAALAGLALLALALAASSWATAMRARRLSRQREALLQEVGLLQAALLPSVPEGAPISVAYRPANGATAGGDFYDAFELADDRLGVILGDVSGHGRDALARTTFVRYTLRAYLEAGLEPREVLKVGSEALAEHLDGGFATVTVAVHEPATGRFTYASAGHPPPVLAGCDEPFEPVTACSAPPLGIDESTGFRQSTFTLTTGARACLYTDGVTEARVDGRLLGLARLELALEALPQGADAERLLDAVADIADEIPDDMAVCLVTGAADVPAAGPRIEELVVDEHEVGDALERFLRACGVALGEVPGILREAGEAARREGSATVRVRSGDFRPGVDVVPGNLVRLAQHRRAVR